MSAPEHAGSDSPWREELGRRLNRRLFAIGIGSNGFGALVVAGFLVFLAPNTLDAGEFERLLERSVPIFVVYMAITLPLGRYVVGVRLFRPIERWLEDDRPATEEERAQVLRYPVAWALGSVPFWLVAAVLFAVLTLDIDRSVALVTAATIVLGALTACTLQYLLVERAMRPLTALALAGGPPPGRSTPGVGARLTISWMLATAVPVLGAISFAAADVLGANLDRDQVVPSILFLCLLAIATGFAAMRFASRSVAEPLENMRGALARVESGNLDSRVDVEDGSEVGLLQAGFNRMVGGLAERERLRDAFGAFVDPELTERVLREGSDLAGEEVELSVLFMDVRGFTSFSEGAEAHEVVAALNDLYECVVPIILHHGGHANKFIGDGLLAIFGAPDRLSDHAERAVAAALELSETVARRDDGLRVGVGVNSGRVVAGTIGGGGRVDFTVIGDTVNTAARVESATRETGDDVLITEATLARLASRNGNWVERPPMPLKGKREQVRLFAPAQQSARI